MKIVVTGGSGFLGSHVADALSEIGHQVTIFDQKKSPYLRQDQAMVVGDLMDNELITALIQEQDIVYHFAGIADIDICAKSPTETARVNILGTVQLLEACRKASIQRFVFASSAYVFSDAGFFYRSSKQACESFIEDYSNLFGLKYTCLRYGSLYGDRADANNSIYRMLRQALLEGKIVYNGQGDELREFIHVRDAAINSVQILAPEFENSHIILTGKEKMAYQELLEMIKEILGHRIEVVIEPSIRKAHYKITPYNFSPKLGKKLVSNQHIDMGQGLLHCMAAIYETEGLHHEECGLMLDGATKLFEKAD